MLGSFSSARFKRALAFGIMSGLKVGPGSGLAPEALEAPVEARELAAGVEQALLAAGPGWVRFRVDFEAQRVARFAVGRARLIAAAVGHHDGDVVIIRLNAVLHRATLR